MSASTPILYFDLGSPYAYLASERAAAVLGTDPELQPVLLGAIFARRGFGSWARSAARDLRIAEIQRRAASYGLPDLRWPATWPGDGLMAMRWAISAKRADAVAAFARSVFRREFLEGADIAEPAVLAACAREAGLDAEELMRCAQTPSVKQELREATEAAWDLGVRGVPSLRIGESVFYGDDQLELAAAALCSQG
jgi:2-hydroxychromene-2-carboxylate isomerase